MKKYLLIAGIISCFTAHSQLEKGKHLLGIQTNLMVGDIYSTALDINIGQSESSFGLNLVPTYGWVLERNWVVGTQANVGFFKIKSNITGKNRTDTYYDLGFEPFTRLYIDITRNKKWKVFGLAALNIAYTANRYSQEGFTSSWISNGTTVTGSLGAGAAYFGRKIAVDLNAANTGLRLGFYKTLTLGKK